MKHGNRHNQRTAFIPIWVLSCVYPASKSISSLKARRRPADPICDLSATDWFDSTAPILKIAQSAYMLYNLIPEQLVLLCFVVVGQWLVGCTDDTSNMWQKVTFIQLTPVIKESSNQMISFQSISLLAPCNKPSSWRRAWWNNLPQIVH